MIERPRIRINQLGYLPDAPKRAVWVTDALRPAPFTVRDSTGAEVFRGNSQPWPQRPEPTSGLPVHVFDLTACTATGQDLRLVAGDDRSHPFRIAADLYAGLARDAFRFFYLLRSGCPIDEERAPGYGRPAGHTGDAAVPALTLPGRFDVSGGWYDAGDYGKYTVSGSVALWQLLQLVRRGAGDRTAEVAEECRWQLDWMLRMQVPPGHPLAGMAFHRVHGTEWSPLPGRPHEDPTERVLHPPSTAATLHLAAVAALGARLLNDDRLLTAARTAWRAARAHPGLIAPDDQGRHGGGPYGDPRLEDDFYWAAAELWLATGDDEYLGFLLASPEHTADVFDLGGFDFDRVGALARLDLATGPRRMPGHDDMVTAAAERLLALQAGQPWGQPYAPAEGWHWGSNGRVLNNLVVLATAHEITGERRFRDAVATGADYLLGRNALGQSYIVGYGTDASAHLRTRQFGHDLDPALPPPPPGALAGGANSIPTPGWPADPRLDGLPPQCRYLDEPTSETTNDICIRWNAPLAFIAAYL
ncbi:glycoside hydrolase family 9 protein, partial [Actinoplanes sp. NPDC051633]|uniref:glycoside hydrolase family 9 protein n=1 Tax=Actinoplanes sp. NPDC051633 TaxID=3155670 RepID=UPI0034477B5A